MYFVLVSLVVLLSVKCVFTESEITVKVANYKTKLFFFFHLKLLGESESKENKSKSVFNCMQRNLTVCVYVFVCFCLLGRRFVPVYKPTKNK